MTRSAAIRGAGLGLFLSLLLLQLAAASDEPLTEEEIVRRHFSGESPAELITLIRSREVRFDTSEEMLQELRRAGIPPSVIDAMVRRQKKTSPDPATLVPDPIARYEGPTRTLRIVLDPPRKQKKSGRKKKPKRISIYDEVHPSLAQDWHLGNAPEDRRYLDMAFFLSCRTPDHVPDHWRIHTPLGDDPRPIARHRMLDFEPAGASRRKPGIWNRIGLAPSADGESAGAEIDSGSVSYGILDLEVPPALEAAVVPDVAHDLSLGIALKIGGSYYLWHESVLDGVVLGADDGELAAAVQKGNMSLEGLSIDFVREREGASSGGFSHGVRILAPTGGDSR